MMSRSFFILAKNTFYFLISAINYYALHLNALIYILLITDQHKILEKSILSYLASENLVKWFA